MNGFMWALVILYWLALFVGNVWLSFHIAEQKNRSDVGWGWLAVFFGLPATLTVAVLPPLKTTVENRAAAKALREREEMRKEMEEWKSRDVGFTHPKMKHR